jgi:hypothetical protein
MRVLFHPEFPKDIRRFRREYAKISEGLATRFQQEVDEAVEIGTNNCVNSSLPSFLFSHSLARGEVSAPAILMRFNWSIQ